MSPVSKPRESDLGKQLKKRQTDNKRLSPYSKEIGIKIATYIPSGKQIRKTWHSRYTGIITW